MSFDINEIRNDFPILKLKVRKKDLVYFDNGATSQKPEMVIERMNDYYRTENSNVHRGVHYLSQIATDAMESAREKVRDFIKAKSISEVIFTKGTTEAINLVASSFGKAFISEGDEIIVSEMEHHANIVPWQMLCQEKGAVLKVARINDDGSLDFEHFKSLLNKNTKLVAIAHTSNVMGVINPVKEIIAEAHNMNIPVLLDGAQAVPHSAVDVQQLDCDFYVFSGHKMYAPTGIGILYGKEEWLDKMPPYQTGGEMIKDVSFEETTFNELPFKFEAGTPMVAEIVGLASAIDYMQTIGIDNIAKYEHDLLLYATEQLSKIDGLKIIGSAEPKAAVVSFVLDGIHHYDAGSILDQLGVAVRTGNHCAQPLMKRMGINGTIRASFSFYNTKEEIDVLVQSIEKVKSMLL
jgi:cysteine desulfurase/selenocysteine lyase